MLLLRAEKERKQAELELEVVQWEGKFQQARAEGVGSTEERYKRRQEWEKAHLEATSKLNKLVEEHRSCQLIHLSVVAVVNELSAKLGLSTAEDESHSSRFNRVTKKLSALLDAMTSSAQKAMDASRLMAAADAAAAARGDAVGLMNGIQSIASSGSIAGGGRNASTTSGGAVGGWVPSSQRKTAPTSPRSPKNMDPISGDDSEDDTGGARGRGRTGSESNSNSGKRSPSGSGEKGAQRKASIEAWGEDKVGDMDGGEKIVMSERQRSPRKSILHMGSKGVVKSTDLIGGAFCGSAPIGGAGGGRAAAGSSLVGMAVAMMPC